MTEFQVNTENGVWLCEKDAHSFDRILADALAAFFVCEKAHSIVDVGCGSGEYVVHLQKWGLNIWGFDGNPKTPEFCEQCKTLDITRDGWEASDAILCLEVAEHIPPKHESGFLDNLCSHAKRLIVLSWFPEEGHGIGHFNPRSNQYVKDRMQERGFTWDGQAEAKLRLTASLWWFSKSLMVYRRTQ